MSRGRYQPVPSSPAQEPSKDEQEPVLVLDKDANKPSFDQVFARRLWRLLGIIFALGRGSVTQTYVFLIALFILHEVFVFLVGTLSPNFYLYLGKRDYANFKLTILKSAIYYILVSVVKSATDYAQGVFALRARKRITTKLTRKYLRNGRPYRIRVLADKASSHQSVPLAGISTANDALSAADASPEHSTRPLPKTDPKLAIGVENPDQRIAEDVGRFTEQLIKIIGELTMKPVLIAYYTYQIYKVAGWVGPTLMYTYFVFSTLICRYVLLPMIPLVYTKERSEGNFRFGFMWVRSHSEQIALQGGEDLENDKLQGLFEAVYDATLGFLSWNFVLKTVVNLVTYYGTDTSYIAIAIPIFMGKYDDMDGADLASLISMNMFLSLYLIYQFTRITELTEDASKLAGYTARISQLLEVLDTMASHDDRQLDDLVLPSTLVSPDQDIEQLSPEQIQLTVDPENGLRRPSSSSIILRDITYSTPTGTLLIQDQSLTIERAQNLLIVGPSGCGKSYLLKVIAGLCTLEHGTIEYPGYGSAQSQEHSAELSGPSKLHPRHLFFLPQNPYLVLNSSLKDQITYPLQATNKGELLSDEELLEILQAVELDYLFEREASGRLRSQKNADEQSLQVSQSDLSQTLSRGEQQRLCIGRILFHKPDFAFLDEALSAVDAHMEARIMKKLSAHNQVTLVSVTQREVLDAKSLYHRQLIFDGWGAWKCQDVRR
ncbi:ABC transporter transmembrane region 2-domain-containing protein [Polychytrium aggregatum]|uniref:ABC transporter transmembrane region 2-domain-containing protein n=1 Tax=Polychytrium aggregatum TaxID=110093 RepID=UPI0022FE7E21|nr:ABC transporter transmembrane region 2-domain-containing protein [Polychytrium aggregatum]KAI9208826.1 ABC transporter transmembrane region 2-domain-containing protein [Polychytrium aggregatum]